MHVTVSESRRPALAAAAVALLLGLIWLAGPRTGTHLAAQIFSADFARHHPLTPVDLRWFSGVQVFRAHAWPPVVLGWVGVRVTGVVAATLASAQVAELFRRTGARRPVVGGVLAALLQALNLVAGQVTFALGLVFALAVLLSFTGSGGGAPLTVLAAFLCGSASPAATVFLWVCGLAYAARGGYAKGLAAIVASAVPFVGLQVLYGALGTRAISGAAARDALIATAIVFVVVPARPIALRVGAGLAFVMVLIAYFFKTPLGEDAALLSLLFAVPVVAAYVIVPAASVAWRPWLAAAAAVVTALPQQLTQLDVVASSPGRDADYYSTLVAQLAARGPLVGRVEVPQTRAHWETAYLARHAQLARGASGPIDRSRNRRVFYTGDTIPPATYQAWLVANSVQYVALPNELALTDIGERERDLIRTRPSYLTPVWSDARWQLFAARGVAPVVRAPGRTTQLTSTSVELRAPARQVVRVQVRWSRSITLSTDDGDACVERSADGHVQLRTAAGGSYRIGSVLTSQKQRC